MTEVDLRFLCAHYRLSGNAPVLPAVGGGRAISWRIAPTPPSGGASRRSTLGESRKLLVDVGVQLSLEIAVRVRVQLIGHLKPCMTEIYLHIVARMADYIATHP